MARIQQSEIDSDPMNFLNTIVEDLDSHFLLPRNPNLTNRDKENRVRWAVKMMIDERENIPARSATIYSACKIALKRAKSQLKISKAASY